MEYFTADWFSTQEALFYEFKGELVDHVSRLEKEEKSSSPAKGDNTSSDQNESKVTTHTNLPRISLPKFSGDYNDWVSFRDLYISVIHQNQNLEDVQKFHYLKTNLTSEAANVIKQFSITNANYLSAWKALTDRYENKRIIVSSLLKSLTGQPKSNTESAHAIKSMLDVTSECLAALNNMQVHTLHWDPLIIHLMTQKLPAETHKAWEESIGEYRDVPTWNDFKKFLEQRFRTLEAIAGIKPRNITIGGRKMEGHKTEVQNFYTSKPSCSLCHEPHPLRSCKQFIKLDAKNRLRVAKSKGNCLNCLGSYHTVNKCLSTVRCAECKSKHHTLLHFASHKLTSPGKELDMKFQNLTSPNKQVTEPSTSNVVTHFIKDNRQVLLATAIVYVQTSAGRLQAARALIDPGSQATFVTSSMLRRMGIKTMSTTVRITGLSNSKAASSRKMAKLILKAPHSDESVEVDAITE